jgi:hypothetical protein
MVKKYHVDSTYRTNQAGCKLFAVIGNINRAGFPVAYLFFKHNMQENETSLASGCKIPAMTAMFRCMHERGLAPFFMFCDKDISEIVSITNVWGPYNVRLCLWHLKQAVDRGLSKPRGQIDPIYVGVEIYLPHKFHQMPYSLFVSLSFYRPLLLLSLFPLDSYL